MEKEAKRKKEDNTCMRTANFEVYLKDDKGFVMRNAIVEDIWTFRRACGNVAGFLYMLEFAIAKRALHAAKDKDENWGPTAPKLFPVPAGINNEVFKQILSATSGFDKKSAVYELAKRNFDEQSTPNAKKGIPPPWTDCPWMAEIASSVQRIVERRNSLGT
jgi:hypothetical protein